jgi:hypothetical protein
VATGDSDTPPIPTPTPEQSVTPPVEPPPAATPPVEPAPAVPAAEAPAAPVASDVPPQSTDAPPPPPPAYAAPAYTAPAYATPSYATPGAYAPARPQGLSIASIICGIAGVLFSFGGFGLLPSIAAVITGHLARKRQPWARGLWLTGMITGYVGIGISIIAGILIIIFFVFAASQSGNYGSYGYNS